MDLPDVNVLIRAGTPDAPGHESAAAWLLSALAGPREFAVAELALSAVVRILTHPGLAKLPLDKPGTISFVRSIRNNDFCVPLVPGPRHFEIFLDLCAMPGVHGKVVPDAYYAAMAIERGYRFVTSDRGFARFPGLDWTLLE